MKYLLFGGVGLGLSIGAVMISVFQGIGRGMGSAMAAGNGYSTDGASRIHYEDVLIIAGLSGVVISSIIIVYGIFVLIRRARK